MTEQDQNWERDTLRELALAGVTEQRRARRWNIFFRLLLFFWLFLFLVIYIAVLVGASNSSMTSGLNKAHTALIDIKGVISADSEASADNIVTALRDAFENKHSKAVIMRINSPGGSPVQSGYVNDEIIRLRNEYPDKKLYAVISDLCASGGYYIAAAADQIYADKASIVGSIGVLMNGFGFTGSMDKLGVERRLITAGEHKGFLDPFSELKDDEVDHAKKLLDNIHEQFVNVVKNGRGERLADDEKLFSGYVWTGEKSVELGLVDALGSSSYVAREVVGEEEIVDYTIKPTYLERFAEKFGTAMGGAIAEVMNIKSMQLN